MADESDPPRKFYEFKPKEFENVNGVPPPLPEAAPGGPPNLPRADPGAGGRIDVKDLFQQAQMGGPLLKTGAQPVGPKNEVHAMLADNLARANATGLNDLAPKPKRVSQRKRQYWLLMIVGNAILLTITLSAGPKNPVQFVYGIAGLVMFNLGLWWVMWQIMEDY